VARDECASGQIEDQAAIHLLIESKVEVIDSLLRIAELLLLGAPLEQTLAPPREFVGDQAGEQIDDRALISVHPKLVRSFEQKDGWKSSSPIRHQN